MKSYPDNTRLAKVKELLATDEKKALKQAWEWLTTGKFTRIDFELLMQMYAEHKNPKQEKPADKSDKIYTPGGETEGCTRIYASSFEEARRRALEVDVVLKNEHYLGVCLSNGMYVYGW